MLSDIYSSNSNFLKAEDLQGKKPVLTISEANVTEKDYGDGQGPKKQIVLSFSQTDKVLGLNFTNASKIAELTGTEDFEKWVGVSIKLYQDQTKVQGVTKPCIRIFPELPEAAQQETAIAATQQFSGPAVDDDSDIPF